MPNAVIAHAADGKFDRRRAEERSRSDWPGLVGMDLVPMVTSGQRFTWDETPWVWGEGFGRQTKPEFHVVAIDYGIKRNILRLLAGCGLQGDGGAGEDFGRGHHGAQARRRVPVERAGRSGGDRRIRRAGDQEADR